MSRIITYSPAYTIVPTYECFNRCSYCNFRSEPGANSWLSLSEAEKKLLSLKNQGIIEILILSGEVHPNSQYRQAWFQLIYDLCKLALSLGFLPHTNVGPLSKTEMKELKQVNVSMGLMLEQITPKLLETVHRNAPSKMPHLRLQQLEWAGELRIPFTTGLLLGIGETVTDSKETLEAIADVHKKWGHIQEVILQPYSPGNQEIWNSEGFDINLLPEVVAIASQILSSSIALQIPPNLVTKPEILLACLENGARDLGGIGPLDEVNPNYPHPHYQGLKKVLESGGWQLIQRLPVYSQYDDWLPINLKNIVSKWRMKLSVKLSPVKSKL
ncbi:MAG: 7,8-didemethyl-8-hydroxy-5-deazariboflavin synthase subunit CofG [Okeania sp. SIO2F4]|uniref:7,8-didemethyl-8-hydroxy-5-deazariboflavin synthase subunit CofG n=1 Tax=Okeania sp. SIO2F4 TaxID=2607790 RepID=UPI00142C4BA4|nr:7,8-didemethyl-8-hydroxy-5-deazariboflavin synthase subunit CofG [Okeania sp. SIO2F4]NES05886.1 7,8-didemethyl-8-hydroxy-5-deazariboflavin synthase subunit CofG [Okeania sp. SIO2F4]